MARFIDRPETLTPPLGGTPKDAKAVWFMRQAQRRPQLPKPLKALGARGAYVPPPQRGSRAAVVKIWTTTKTGGTAGHLSYMRQEGKGRDGADAPLFTTDGESLHTDAFVHAAKEDPHQFRMIVSVTSDWSLDYTSYTRALMAQVEQDVGTKLDWIAATHYDTAHRHVHLIIRGRDVEGESFYLKKHYFTHGMRHQAEQVATTFLGYHQTEQTQHLEAEKTSLRDLAFDKHMAESKRSTDDPRTPFLETTHGWKADWYHDQHHDGISL